MISKVEARVSFGPSCFTLLYAFGFRPLYVVMFGLCPFGFHLNNKPQLEKKKVEAGLPHYLLGGKSF